MCRFPVTIREAESRINVNEGIVSLNLTKEQTEATAQELNKSKAETESSVQELNKSLKGLNDQKVKESIKNVEITQKDLDWMDKNDVNRNDSVVTKTIKYLADQTNMSEGELIILMGGYTVLKDAIGLTSGLIGGMGKGIGKNIGKNQR